MNKIKFITDSTAYFNKEYSDEKNIGIVPLKYEFESRVFSEGLPGEFGEFFDLLKNSADFPKTSQPAVGEFVKVFQDALEDGFEVIAITISSKLSGTVNSASIAAEMLDSSKIAIIDSEAAASTLRFLVERGIKLSEEGKSRSEIVEMLEKEKKRMKIDLTVDTLDYLKKGGRLSSAQAFIGGLLNIRPVIGLRDGKLEPIDKARGKGKALEIMIQDIPQDVKRLSICHILSVEEAEEIRLRLREKFKGIPITIDELGPVVGCHLGPKAIGICSMW